MHKQQGMTLIGLVLTVLVVVGTAVVVMRVVPVYLQHYSLVQSIKALNSTPDSLLTGDAYTDVDTLRKSLSKRFDINGVDDLKADQLTITPSGLNRFRAHLKYQVVKPLVYNVSLLFDFDDTYEVVTGGEH
ncbi:DUF4845 domain-containing protein [Legionella worsleiensis]|uniref:Transmembrane protein n=1 Tax=Legionella worsleiensis TaxID=45076 RepID=A0A0W1A5Y2_9GAMM|nr:DUF4845 domain-containing protein [Legionella worsleiensis]KTD76751.1 transmembrane protein [Legionella worsleiensis]STY30557.1 transmembrane protein [Legionella worsleiensis]